MTQREDAPGTRGGADPADPPLVGVDGPETVAEEQLLSSLRQRARTVNRARVGRLVDLFDAAQEGRLDEQGRGEGESLAHQVVGSAGTFGSPAASRDAVVVEEWFAGHDRGSRPRRSRTRDAAVRATLERLRTEFDG